MAAIGVLICARCNSVNEVVVPRWIAAHCQAKLTTPLLHVWSMYWSPYATANAIRTSACSRFPTLRLGDGRYEYQTSTLSSGCFFLFNLAIAFANNALVSYSLLL